MEVKLSATITGSDLRGMKALRDATSARFRRGVILYSDDRVVPMDIARPFHGRLFHP